MTLVIIPAYIVSPKSVLSTLSTPPPPGITEEEEFWGGVF